MSRIIEDIETPAKPQPIWDYVQDYHRRAERDVTTARFEPIDAARVENDVRVYIQGAGRPYDAGCAPPCESCASIL